MSERPDYINGMPGKLPPQRPSETRAKRESDIDLMIFVGIAVLVVVYFALKAADIVYHVN